MDELAKALAEAVRSGTQLAWPALVLYIAATVVTKLAVSGTCLGITWLAARAFLRYPIVDAEAMYKRNAAEKERYEEQRQHQAKMNALVRGATD